jgi:bifunctional oligoribonuclease and PAP phosphatase NrnA
MTSPNDRLATAIDAVTPLLRTPGRFVLTTHVNPDGDGLGSELALAFWLRDRGNEVHVINTSDTPAVYRFLDPDGLIARYDPASHDATIARAGAILVMDMNHPDRLRDMSAPVLASPAVKVCIDHHLDPDPFARWYVTDDNATSTGEIVFRVLTRLNGGAVSPAIATALYTAIMTDTGSFRYPRVDEETHGIIGRLIAAGADPVRIYSAVYEQWSPGRIRLLGEMLSGLTTEYDGRLAHVTITQEMLRRTGTTEEDTDNFTTYPMSVTGVQVGILFLELPRGMKMSLRSRGEIPINELARLFGGNGHKNAAGARVENGTIEEVRPRVIGAAASYLETRQ